MMEEKWKQTKRMWTETREETVDRKRAKDMDWMSAETLRKIQERRKKKVILITCRTGASSKAEAQWQCTRAHKEARRSIRREKRSHIDNLARHAEKAAAQGVRVRLLQCHNWRLTRMLTITFHVFSSYRLDFEQQHRGIKEWNSVDPLVTAGGLRLCQ